MKNIYDTDISQYQKQVDGLRATINELTEEKPKNSIHDELNKFKIVF